jgi:hypothetical protein
VDENVDAALAEVGGDLRRKSRDGEIPDVLVTLVLLTSAGTSAMVSKAASSA